jgi:hypothetical protein
VEKKQTIVSASKWKKHRFLFRNPKINDIEKLAERIISLKLIDEVSLEDHREGYAATVTFMYPASPVHARAYLSALVSRDFGEVVIK